MGFWGYIKGTIVSPRKTFGQLVVDPKNFKYANILLISWVILIYPSTIYYMAIGMKPFFPTFIKIPPEDYFFWELFFVTPVTFLGFLQFAGLVKWVARWQGKDVPFIGLYSVFIFLVAVPCILIWWPSDHVFVTLFALGKLTPEAYLQSHVEHGAIYIENNIVATLGFLWQLVLMQIALKEILNMHFIKTLVLNMTSLITFYVMWGVVWIR